MSNLNKKDVIIMTRQKTITLKLTLAEVEELRRLWGIEHITHKADFKQNTNYRLMIKLDDAILDLKEDKQCPL